MSAANAPRDPYTLTDEELGVTRKIDEWNRLEREHFLKAYARERPSMVLVKLFGVLGLLWLIRTCG